MIILSLPIRNYNKIFTECTMGTYGQDCAHKCSEKCLNEIACNKTTGKCDTGCDFGYTGDLCETGSIISHVDLNILSFRADFSG